MLKFGSLGFRIADKGTPVCIIIIAVMGPIQTTSTSKCMENCGRKTCLKTTTKQHYDGWSEGPIAPSQGLHLKKACGR